MIVPNVTGRTTTTNLMRDAVASSVRKLRRMYDRAHAEGIDNFPIRQWLSKYVIENYTSSL